MDKSMMGNEMKQAALAAIEANKERLMQIGRDLYSMPEPGFLEARTSAYVKERLEETGLTVRSGIAITGLTARAKGRKSLMNVGLMGELDSLIMPSHPKAAPGTGYFHGCGHHAQLTTVIGAAIGLMESGVAGSLDGDLTFIAVPAEEATLPDLRRTLIREGKIAFTSGKQEMIRLGVFDDIDMVLCSHMLGKTPDPRIWVGHSWNGILQKSVRYTGKSAHAGLAPDTGINALEAALCGLNAVNALRERFRDEDHVRIHYIITKGGDSPAVVPDDVRLEFGVRAATFEAMMHANEMVDRALRFGGESVGAGVEIHDFGGILPCHQSREMGELYLKNAEALLGQNAATNVFGEHRGSSTDCGEVASLMPLIHPYFGGAVGLPHGLDFDVVNDYAAYVVPAKVAAMTVIDLLCDDAKEAKAVKAAYKPVFANKEEYLEYAGKLAE